MQIRGVRNIREVQRINLIYPVLQKTHLGLRPAEAGAWRTVSGLATVKGFCPTESAQDCGS